MSELLSAPRGPWHKAPPLDTDAPDPGGPPIEFDTDERGQPFAVVARELLFLVNDIPISDFVGELANAMGISAVDATDPRFENVETCDAVGGELRNALKLGDGDIDAFDAARVIKVRFDGDFLRDVSDLEGLSTYQLYQELRRRLNSTGSAIVPALNTVYFSTATKGALMGSPVMTAKTESAPVMWSSTGAPVMWSSVGGAPVMWSSVGGAPVMWSSTGAPVMWSSDDQDWVGLDGAPVMWSNVHGQPVMWSSDVGATPVMWSGIGGSPVMWSGAGNSLRNCCCDDDRDLEKLSQPDSTDTIFTSARPALNPGHAPRLVRRPESECEEDEPQPRDHLDLGRCLVVVLDTGIDKDGSLFKDAHVKEINGLVNEDEVNYQEADEYIDPAAGHGTFIAGLIHRLAPEAEILVGRVLSSFGHGSECAIGTVIRFLADQMGPGILNLSFVGYYPNDEPPPVLADAIEYIQDSGWVVVASAGNDATCRYAFPAALPAPLVPENPAPADDSAEDEGPIKRVISVGALAPWGPAWFTNHGSWVRACAPGFDIVSNYFDFSLPDSHTLDNGGVLKRNDATDASEIRGWAAWSGTSFSAPIVAAALARDVIAAGPPKDVEKLRKRRLEIVNGPGTNQQKTDALHNEPIEDFVGTREEIREVQLRQAVQRVITDWRLARVPCLGTIVNDHL